MGKRNMCLVDVAFIALQEVAVMERFRGEPMRVRRVQKFVGGQERWLARTEIRQDEPAHLLARVRFVKDLLVKGAARWFARLLQATPVPVVEPAMVDTAEATVF